MQIQVASSLRAGRDHWLQHPVMPSGADTHGTGRTLHGGRAERSAAPSPAVEASLRHGQFVWPFHLQVPLQEFLRWWLCSSYCFRQLASPPQTYLKEITYLSGLHSTQKEGISQFKPCVLQRSLIPQTTSIAEHLRETGRRLCSAVTNADSSPRRWHQPFPQTTNNLHRIAGTRVNSKMRQPEIQTSYGDESAAQCVRDALETAYELQTLTYYKCCATFLCIILMRVMKKMDIIPTF